MTTADPLVSAERSTAPVVFRDGSWPTPRRARARLAVRAFAVATVALTLAYLTWRVAGGTVSAAWWWAAVPLLVVELHNAFGLVLYTIALWDTDVRPAPVDAPLPNLRVAVLIPTYNEPTDVLLPTIRS